MNVMVMDAETVNSEVKGEVLEALAALDVDDVDVLDNALFVQASVLGQGRLPAALGVRPDGVGVVVADRISQWARDELVAHGWGFLDRRGYLSLSAPGVTVRAQVPNRSATVEPLRKVNLRAGTAQSVAMALLVDTQRRCWGVRELARHLEVSPAAVSKNLAQLRNADLVTNSNEPLIPELFWALADVWDPATAQIPVSLDTLVSIGRQRNKPVGDSNGTGPGWALAGDRVAQHHGFGIQPATSALPVVYVDTKRTIDALATWARQQHEPGNAVIVKTAASAWATTFREPGDIIANAAPLICALDLAQDARGRKALNLSKGLAWQSL